MMGFNPSPSPSHLYPEELQLKLYQAFIFSIPILISIILLLLLYLFYLKRRTSNSPLPILDNLQPSSLQLPVSNLKSAKLETVSFDQVLTTTDSMCCVCLGEFEMEEVLHQIPACRHVFHGDCIRLWLLSNTTCPLCRCFIAPRRCRTPKLDLNSPSSSVVIQVEEFDL
ncbi:probable E3 ubiquitin-protein ligase RHA4A [Impatiens glandulifera]|uniref:probable E3 ubiquitin-protein ligase RHA4A n=1 Tax=Impatiens glandulifera TaxID=253017 RepID=UPI001FB071A3|nr:probable E3 ubiquitin-protein ligase RHA4A [Impatiens glandulifera]